MKSYAVGKILTLIRRPIVVDPTEIYREIGIRSFGRGVFHKSPVSGADLGSKRVFRIEPGELLFSNVFAWEGAVAVSAVSECGMIGSHRFLTFSVNAELADIRYLKFYFQIGEGLAAVRAASPGSAGRNKTLGIDAFSNQRINLPSVVAQQHIAQKLEAIKATVDRVSTPRRQRLMEMLASLEDSLIQRYCQGWRRMPLGSLAELNPKPIMLHPDDCVLFVPMASVDEQSGAISASAQTMAAAEAGKGFKQFIEGDVLFARITPCMQNGKSAVARMPVNVRAGFGSTEFHVIRPNDDVNAEWIHRWVRMISFRNQAKSSFTGTAGQQRVPAEFLIRTEIPVAPDADAEIRTLKVLEDLTDKLRQVAAYQQRTFELSNALWRSALNAAFSGQL
jgi:type I restriction enzyme S subunit